MDADGRGAVAARLPSARGDPGRPGADRRLSARRAVRARRRRAGRRLRSAPAADRRPGHHGLRRRRAGHPDGCRSDAACAAPGLHLRPGLLVRVHQPGVSIAGSGACPPRSAQGSVRSRIHKHQPGAVDRSGAGRTPHREDRRDRRVRSERADLFVLCRRAHRLAPAGRRRSRAAGTISFRDAGRRPVRPQRAGRAPDPAPGDPFRGPGERGVVTIAARRHRATWTRRRRLWLVTRCPWSGRGGGRADLAPIQGTPFGELPDRGGKRDLCALVSSHRRRAQPGPGGDRVAARGSGLDRGVVGYQRRAPALSPGMGPRPRAVCVPDGPVRRSGCRRVGMGGDRRTVRRQRRIPDRCSGDGGWSRDHPVLAVSRHCRHGAPHNGVLARAASGFRRETRQRSCCGQEHVHDRGGEGAVVPGGDDSLTPIATSDGRHAVGTLQGRGGRASIRGAVRGAIVG